MRFIRRRSSFRDRLLQLRSFNDRLKLHLEDHPLPSSTGSRRKPIPNISFPRLDRCADDIYYAIKNGYQCPCDAAHSAHLGLPELPSSIGHQTLNDNAGNCFRLLFVVDDSLESEARSVVTTQSSQDGDVKDAPNAREGQAQEDLHAAAKVVSKAEYFDDR